MSSTIKTNIKKLKQENKRLESDWNKIDQATDEELEKEIDSDPDAAPVLDEEWFKKAHHMVPSKDRITLRLDHDIISFFKQQGKGYQTRINQVLRAFVEAHKGS